MVVAAAVEDETARERGLLGVVEEKVGNKEHLSSLATDVFP